MFLGMVLALKYPYTKDSTSSLVMHKTVTIILTEKTMVNLRHLQTIADNVQVQSQTLQKNELLTEQFMLKGPYQ